MSPRLMSFSLYLELSVFNSNNSFFLRSLNLLLISLFFFFFNLFNSKSSLSFILLFFLSLPYLHLNILSGDWIYDFSYFSVLQWIGFFKDAEFIFDDVPQCFLLLKLVLLLLLIVLFPKIDFALFRILLINT